MSQFADPLVALVTLAHRQFPDFEFFSPGGLLRIDRSLGMIDRVRIELPTAQPLHLQSVGIIAESVEHVAAIATVRASSWYGDYERRLDTTRLLDADHPSGTALHTVADPDGSWVEIDFAHPIDVLALALRNVANRLNVRARGIRVLAGSGPDALTLVYDSAARQREVEVLFARESAARVDLDDNTRAFVPILAKAVAADYAAARAAFNELHHINPQRRTEFRAFVSDFVLATRSLEWTIHGPQRCFRFWSVDEKRTYLRFANQVVDDLRTLTAQVCFGFGAALAVVRNGDMIPHDDDLDIIVGFEARQAATLPAANRLIEEHLRARGYHVSGKFTAHRHVLKAPAPKVDVFVGIFEGDTIAWYPGKRGSLTRTMMFPTSEAGLLGEQVRLPRNPLLYLEQVYGADWRTPNPGFTHTWNNAAYQDLIKKWPEPVGTTAGQ